MISYIEQKLILKTNCDLLFGNPPLSTIFSWYVSAKVLVYKPVILFYTSSFLALKSCMAKTKVILNKVCLLTDSTLKKPATLKVSLEKWILVFESESVIVCVLWYWPKEFWEMLIYFHFHQQIESTMFLVLNSCCLSVVMLDKTYMFISLQVGNYRGNFTIRLPQSRSWSLLWQCRNSTRSCKQG